MLVRVGGVYRRLLGCRRALMGVWALFILMFGLVMGVRVRDRRVPAVVGLHRQKKRYPQTINPAKQQCERAGEKRTRRSLKSSRLALSGHEAEFTMAFEVPSGFHETVGVI